MSAPSAIGLASRGERPIHRNAIAFASEGRGRFGKRPSLARTAAKPGGQFQRVADGLVRRLARGFLFLSIERQQALHIHLILAARGALARN
jgi:hypothetical protein